VELNTISCNYVNILSLILNKTEAMEPSVQPGEVPQVRLACRYRIDSRAVLDNSNYRITVSNPARGIHV